MFLLVYQSLVLVSTHLKVISTRLPVVSTCLPVVYQSFLLVYQSLLLVSTRLPVISHFNTYAKIPRLLWRLYRAGKTQVVQLKSLEIIMFSFTILICYLNNKQVWIKNSLLFQIFCCCFFEKGLTVDCFSLCIIK